MKAFWRPPFCYFVKIPTACWSRFGQPWSVMQRNCRPINPALPVSPVSHWKPSHLQKRQQLIARDSIERDIHTMSVILKFRAVSEILIFLFQSQP